MNPFTFQLRPTSAGMVPRAMRRSSNLLQTVENRYVRKDKQSVWSRYRPI
jgi:hypothetical protein